MQAPSGPLLARLVTVADEIAAARIPYCYGGGHVTPARPTHGTYCHNAANEFISGSAYDGLDCSSSVSMLLQLSGVNTPTLDSTGFMSFGEPGPGEQFTIWANPAHVFVSIDGRDWGTSDANPFGGPGWAPHTHRRLHPTTPGGPMSRRALPLLLAAVIALAGCGLRDPYSQQPPTRTAAARGQAAQAPLPQATLERANSASERARPLRERHGSTGRRRRSLASGQRCWRWPPASSPTNCARTPRRP